MKDKNSEPSPYLSCNEFYSWMTMKFNVHSGIKAVTKLTIAIFCKEFKKTAITLLDTKTKDIALTWTFLDHIYQELIDTPDKSQAMEKVIWTDRPISEYKTNSSYECWWRGVENLQGI